VELHVLFTAKTSELDSRFFLLPAGGRDTRLLAYPFFLAAIEPMHELRDGMLVFDGLPRGARVRVRMLRPGFAPATSDEIRLDKDVVAAVVRGDVRARVSGMVVDSSAKPVPNVWLTTRAGDSGLSLRDTGWLLPPGAYVADGDVTRTSETGAFVLSRSSDKKGRTVLAMESEGCIGLAYTLMGKGDRTVTVRLFETRPVGTPRIRLQAGSGLSGQVRLMVHDEGGDHGPYSWQSETPFPLRISRRSLFRIRLRVDDEEPVVYDDVLVVGETGFSVAR
jgi:hypothetical protein